MNDAIWMASTATSTTLIVAVLKRIFRTRARTTHVLALIVAGGLVVVTGRQEGYWGCEHALGLVLATFNATAAAIGLHQTTTGVSSDRANR